MEEHATSTVRLQRPRALGEHPRAENFWALVWGSGLVGTGGERSEFLAELHIPVRAGAACGFGAVPQVGGVQAAKLGGFRGSGLWGLRLWGTYNRGGSGIRYVVAQP